MDYLVLRRKFYQIITIAAQGKAQRTKYERIYKLLLQYLIDACACLTASEYFAKRAKSAKAEALKRIQKIPPICESFLNNLSNDNQNRWKFKTIARIACELIDEIRNET